MQGKIIKGIAGFYYVDTGADGLYTCRAKGVFRNEKITPLVGDNVVIEITSEEKKEGNIVDILERSNALIRPAAANVDQALVVFAAAKPDPNFNLLDRFLVMMQKQGIHTVVCFNKTDIVGDSDIERLKNAYELCGHELLFISVRDKVGIDAIRNVLKGKTTVLAGPSGVGKSSLMNLLAPEANMVTGELSKKIDRGKQTTRHTELIRIAEGTYLCDTPGFTSLYVTDIAKDELRDYFVEFNAYRDSCRFDTCRHIKEPGCAVKAALEAGDISRIRYENYCMMFNELEKQEKRKY
ncbi:MAG: ribosome small subunit-dependent GTPase A [Lachnospiraceae bacterium]|nr:ribosome small subunit-dependent GTPase A [Lachnospiraceae bacterium]MBR5731857.1 ribosome small subunit-dependent GTPase A [Lachnospiraceae bacterium]